MGLLNLGKALGLSPEASLHGFIIFGNSLGFKKSYSTTLKIFLG